MKRIMIPVLVLIMIFVLNVYVHAEEMNMGDSFVLNENVAQILDSQYSKLPESEKELIRSGEELDMEYGPILKVYNDVHWDLVGKPLAEIVATAETRQNSRDYSNYYVLSDIPYHIRIFQGELSRMDGKEIPRYVRDIYEMSQTVEFKGKQSKLKGIYCFDGVHSFCGIVVYIQTDTNTVVKYYPHYNKEALVFSEKQFQKYGSGYFDYITSYEHNYDEKGNALGGVLTFETYIKNPSRYRVQGEKINVNDIIWIGASLFIAISAVTIGLVVYKRVRRCKDI